MSILAIDPGAAISLDLPEIAFDVLGTPAPKGSSRALMRGGKAVNVSSGSDAGKAKLTDWGGAIRAAALNAVSGGYSVEAPPFVDIPLFVAITFRMARSPAHWGRGRNAGKLTPSAPVFPRVKPDIDKLARSTLDAMTGIVFDDDSRIVTLVLAKEYAAPGREGATIRIQRAA